MKRRTICRGLAAMPMAVAMAAAGQSPLVLRVAWVSPETRGAESPNLAALRNGLRELGYVEGRNLAIDTFWGEGSDERLERMAGDIVRSRPDVIVAAGGFALFPMMRAGVKLPIALVLSADPVVAKVVASFARPGGNLTGVSLFSLDLMGKRLEYLKAAMPGLKRIAIIANPGHSGESLEYVAAHQAAQGLGLSYRFFPAHDERGLEQSLAAIAKGRDETILAFADFFMMAFAERIAAFSVQHNVPAISGWAQFAQRGNLMSYGPVIDECFRRLAVYADKIFKGAKPADLPVERPTKVELVINLKTAKALGLTIPQSLLLRADEVI